MKIKIKKENEKLTKEIEFLKGGKNVIESHKTEIPPINKNNKKYPKKYKKKIKYPKDENNDSESEDDNDSDYYQLKNEENIEIGSQNYDNKGKGMDLDCD